MGKIARVKVTLPIEVYKELDRRVEYEVKVRRSWSITKQLTRK